MALKSELEKQINEKHSKKMREIQDQEKYKQRIKS
jgi:hypothetical protein